MIDFVVIPEKRLKLLKKNKEWVKKLEEYTGLKIKINKEIFIEGDDSLKIYRTKLVLKAFGRGFDLETALNLLDENYYFETINIKDYSKKSKNRLITLKGRVIGTKGKTKRIIERYAEVKISIYGKTIGIIGSWERVMLAKKAIEMLLAGSLHSTVYRFLEKHKR